MPTLAWACDRRRSRDHHGPVHVQARVDIPPIRDHPLRECDRTVVGRAQQASQESPIPTPQGTPPQGRPQRAAASSCEAGPRPSKRSPIVAITATGRPQKPAGRRSGTAFGRHNRNRETRQPALSQFDLTKETSSQLDRFSSNGANSGRRRKVYNGKRLTIEAKQKSRRERSRKGATRWPLPSASGAVAGGPCRAWTSP